MKQLIETMARHLVDREDQVVVNETRGTGTTVIELNVAKEDVGKVIGKQGRTAVAMRTILSAYAMKVGKRAILEIIE